MYVRLLIAAVLLAAGCCLAVPAQDVPAQTDVVPGGIHTTPRPEPPVEGFVRRDHQAVVLTLPLGKPLVLRDFDFNGDPVDTDKLHLRLLSPGVYELTSVAYDVGYWRFYVADAASYFGMGEHFDTLDHAHTVVHNLSLDNAGVKGSGTYKPIPFFLSTTGYGLWFDTTGDATFDFNASDKDQVTVDAATNRLRLVLFTGQPEGVAKADAGRFPNILASFARLAGPVTVPPYWAFAPWHSRDYHESQAQVVEDIDRTRELGLPASVIVLDSPWATAYNSYTFNPKQFADAPAMVKHLHEAGYKLVLWHTPWINSKNDPPTEPGFADKIEATSPNYAVAEERGFFVKTLAGKPYVGHWWKGEGSLIDFTNPKAKEWWQDQVRLAIHAGADGFKNDDGEGSFVGAEFKFADGTDARLMRNRYGTLFNNAVEELIQQDLKGNGAVFARSVTTGANGIGFLWGGDNAASFSGANGLPSVVTAGLSAGLSGMPLWSADLGGYEKQPDTPNALLIERWTEFAAFSPVMEIHSQANLTPWTFDGGTGTEALDIYRKFAVLHMSLFPYRYGAAMQAANTGQPILRALVLEYQDDLRAREIKDEYLFGPDLLVAPVIDENTSRVVYLPAGEWLNLFTGEPVSGPQTVIAKAPRETIPVYARRGTVLPKIPEDVMTLVTSAESGNQQVHALDDRRVYEILGPAAGHDTGYTDFEGRTIVRSGNTLAIKPAAESAGKTHVIVRWRFVTPAGVTVNGAAAESKADANGVATIEFDLTAATLITWR